MSAKVLDDEGLLAAHRRLLEDGNWQSYGPDARRIQKLYSKAKGNGRLSRVLAAAGLDGGPMPDGRKGGAPAASQGGDAPLGGGVSWEESRDTAAWTFTGPTRITTLDELLVHCGADMSVWEVEKWGAGAHEMGTKNADGEAVTTPLYRAWARFRRIPGAAAINAIRASVLADMAAHAPRYAGVRYGKVPQGDRHMLEVCTMDLHAGAYVWGEECGEDYDSDIARDLVGDAIAQLAQRASGFPVDKILLPLGNDLAHSDRQNGGAGGMTTKGTVVDVDTRRARLMRMLRVIAVESIDTLRSIAPVEVIVVRGNHDADTMIALGEIVAAWYRNDDCVTIRNEPTERKYVRYGVNLLGFTHGHNEKHSELPLIMATEAPADWAATTHREYHIGHLHRKGEVVSEHSGVRVRVMPSLAADDAWHRSQGYAHMRAAEAYLWSHDTGYVGHFSVSRPGTLGKAA